jgi:hypothetical protein
MKVYHGSYIAIENIDFSFCRKRRDFGKGFYVTKFFLQAEYWAERKGEDHDTEGIITEFEFDESFFEDEDIKVLRFDSYNDKWLDFIVLNRLNKNEAQAHDYDMIEGPVADDDIATRVYDYIKGKVSKTLFLKELTHKTPTHQICFCTMKSLQALEQDKYSIDSKMMMIDKQIIKNLIIEKKMTEFEATDKYYTSNLYARLSDEATKFYEKEWSEIYQLLIHELS